MTKIEKHEKAILILENINRLERRINANEINAIDYAERMRDHCANRVIIDTKIKERLINSYKAFVDLEIKNELTEYYNNQNFKL